MAYQVDALPAVENYRIVSRIAEVIQEVDTTTKLPICNTESCPRMTAGR